MNERATRVSEVLDLLGHRGVLDYYQRRGGMKRPWLLVAPGFERAMTTREAEAFTQGALLALHVEEQRAAA